MTRNKKIIISALVAAALIVLIIIGTFVVISLIDKNNNTNKKVDNVVPTTKAVKNLRDDAEKARASGNKDDAKTLLTEAKQQIEELPKTDENTNAKVDIEAQLFLLENANK